MGFETLATSHHGGDFGCLLDNFPVYMCIQNMHDMMENQESRQIHSPTICKPRRHHFFVLTVTCACMRNCTVSQPTHPLVGLLWQPTFQCLPWQRPGMVCSTRICQWSIFVIRYTEWVRCLGPKNGRPWRMRAPFQAVILSLRTGYFPSLMHHFSAPCFCC